VGVTARLAIKQIKSHAPPLEEWLLSPNAFSFPPISLPSPPFPVALSSSATFLLVTILSPPPGYSWTSDGPFPSPGPVDTCGPEKGSAQGEKDYGFRSPKPGQAAGMPHRYGGNAKHFDGPRQLSISRSADGLVMRCCRNWRAVRGTGAERRVHGERPPSPSRRPSSGPSNADCLVFWRLILPAEQDASDLSARHRDVHELPGAMPTIETPRPCGDSG